MSLDYDLKDPQDSKEEQCGIEVCELWQGNNFIHIAENMISLRTYYTHHLH